jgi:hypothetical protein
VPDLHDAVGELIRAQTRTVHYLPGDPDRWYTVRAPCLLTQLRTTIASSTGGRGGRTVPSSRLPLDSGALDLWVEITGNVHAWADALHIDRRPYRAAERTQFTPPDRMPGWLRRTWVWSSDHVDQHGTPVPIEPLPPVAPAIYRLALEDHDPLTDRTIPPVGQLLKAVAARAASLAVDEVTERITTKSTGWTSRIRAMLAGLQVDEQIRPIRGAQCPECGASTAPEQRDDGLYLVPAVQVRFMPLDGADGELWAYRMCIACGDNGWVEYTTETEPPGEAA